MRASSMKSCPTSGGGGAGFASAGASTGGFASTGGALATAEGALRGASTGAALASGWLLEHAQDVSASARRADVREESFMRSGFTRRGRFTRKQLRPLGPEVLVF